MTNREVLARKSNEELAKFIKLKAHRRCEFCVGQCAKQDCLDGIQQWLEQEAKDDE